MGLKLEHSREMSNVPAIVIASQGGIPEDSRERCGIEWIPACAGMTEKRGDDGETRG